MSELMRSLNELMRTILFLPEQASTMSTHIDHLHYFVIIASMFASVGIGLTAVAFFIRFRQVEPKAITPEVEPAWWFEALSIGIPLGLFLWWFGIGFRDYVRLATPPPSSMEVYVTGKQWMWKFAYPHGPNSIGTLHVPAHRPVKLLMTSRDVIHSFYVPSFRIKQDVLPGRYTQQWFEATKPGRYQIFCAEYCGVSHSNMLGEIVVLKPEEFDAWMNEQQKGLKSRADSGGSVGDVAATAGTLVDQGRLLAGKYGCLKCHSVDGTQHIGPSFLDLFGKREKLQSGETLIVDEGYITQSMMDPLAKIVAGYNAVMPTFQGRLAAPETAAIVEYIKSLRSDRLQPEPAQRREGPLYEPTRGR